MRLSIAPKHVHNYGRVELPRHSFPILCANMTYATTIFRWLTCIHIQGVQMTQKLSISDSTSIKPKWLGWWNICLLFCQLFDNNSSTKSFYCELHFGFTNMRLDMNSFWVIAKFRSWTPCTYLPKTHFLCIIHDTFWMIQIPNMAAGQQMCDYIFLFQKYEFCIWLKKR